MEQTDNIHNFITNIQITAVFIITAIAAILSSIIIILLTKKINTIKQKEKINLNDKEKIFNSQLIRFLAIMLLMMNLCLILFMAAIV